MQEIVHNINLNVSQPNAFEYLHCVQGDHDAEKVIATLYDGNQLYEIGTDCKAMLQGSTESDGLIMQNYLTISEDRHKVEFVITKEMSSCVGNVTYNIVLSSADGAKKSTFPFVIKNTADITGRTPVSVLTTISDYVDRAEKAAKDSETNKVTTDENVVKATEQATIATTKATESANSAKEATKQANIALTKAEESANSAQESKDQADIATTKAQEASSSASDSANSASESATSASNAKTSETNAGKSATASANSASASASSATTSAEKAKASSDSATAAALSEKNAKASETASKTSETNAKASETNASVSATTATEQAKASSDSATASANSATQAEKSATAASTKASEASVSAENAKASESASALSEKNAAASATTASTKADEASTSAVTANVKATIVITKASEAATSAKNASTSEKNASASADISTVKAKEASDSAIASADSATLASEKASDAASSANSANTSAINASKSETNAKTSADSASLSATNASTSEINAQSSATASSKSAQASATSEANAKQSATNAKASETSASKYASNASISATTASEKADVATTKATESVNSATDALTYANQSKDYRDQCKSIAQGLEGALLPKGTISFAELPTKDISTGDMYNISDEFTSDDRFKDGAGKVYTAGTNIYYTSDGLWDVLIGDLEKYAFKTDLEDHVGNKSNPHGVTKSQVGLGNVPNVTTNDQTVTYTDSSTLTTLSSGEKMSVAFGKMKKAISDLISHIADTTKHITSSERTLWNTVSSKVDKVDGKGLSTNDYTTAEKNKLNGIELGANKYVHPGSGTNPHGTTKSDVGLGNVGNFKAVSTVASQGLTDTEKAHARTNIGAQAAGSYSTTGHKHTKSEITDFPSSMPASDVYAWAKASTKPTYTWSEITSKPSSFTPSSHTHSYNDLSNKPTLGSAASKTVRTLSTTGNSGWKDLTTDQGYVPDMAFIALWNGTYNGSASNLAYCNKGAFGTAATANKGDFATAGHTHNYAGSSSAGGSATSLNYFQNTSNTNIGQDTATSNAIGYITDYSGTALTTNVKDGALYRQAYSTKWVHEIYGDYRTGQIALRGKNNGTWQDWRTVLDSSNFSNYAASKSHTHSNYLTSITKAMVTNALGYTPPTSDTNTWRGIQNNLTSDSTSDSLSAAQGKVLKGLIDGKADSTHTHSDYVTKNAASTVNAAITFGKSDTYGIFTSTDNYCNIGSSSAYFYKAYIANIYSKTKVQSPVYYVGDSNNIYFNTTRAMLKDDTYANEMNIDGFSSVVYNNTSRRVVFGFPHKSTAPAEMGIYLYDANNYACGKFYVANGTSGANTSILETGTVKCKSIYNYSGSAPTISDRNKKDHIAAITDELAQQVVEGANPVTYKYKEGTSDRTHYGFIAQDFETLINKLGIDSKDFAPLVKEYQKKDVTDENGEIRTVPDYDAEPTYFIRYEELIAFLYKYVQNLKKENIQLKEDIVNLNKQIDLFTKRLTNVEQQFAL